MTFEIHYELPDGSEDMIIVVAPTIEEVRWLAETELAKRGGINPWSRETEE